AVPWRLGISLLERCEVAIALSRLIPRKASELRLRQRTDEVEIRQDTGELIDGKRPQLFLLVSLIDAVKIGDHEIRARCVMDEMPPHPIEAHLGRTRDGRLEGAAQLLDDSRR